VEPASRIVSIIALQSAVFDSPLVGLSPRETGEYGGLLDFADRPDPAAIARIRSILRLHELLFGDEAGEMPFLAAYLDSLAAPEPPAPRRAAILPANLGRTFAAKGWGSPLFGGYRPAAPPSGGGSILRYRSADADGTALIAASPLGTRTALAYRGAGVVVASQGSWLECVISPAGGAGAEAADADPACAGRGRAASRGRDLHRFVRCIVELDRAPRPLSLKDEFLDPYAYEYAYYFFEGGRMAANIAAFVVDVLSGSHAVPFREAERIGGLFSERMPKS